MKLADKKAFTLAEVLITLGIIGVVAALTLPTLIQSYKKKVIETRLAKFASIYRQAITMAEVEHGPKEHWNLIPSNPSDPSDDLYKTKASGEEYLAIYQKYLGKYLKTDSYTTLPNGVAFELADGSGFIFYYDLQFCVDYKKCLNIIDKADTDGISVTNGAYYVDGKNIFLFSISGKTYTWKWDGSEDDLVNNPEFGCRENSSQKLFCTKIIERNGWKIPDDYPIKL